MKTDFKVTLTGKKAWMAATAFMVTAVAATVVLVQLRK